MFHLGWCAENPNPPLQERREGEVFWRECATYVRQQQLIPKLRNFGGCVQFTNAAGDMAGIPAMYYACSWTQSSVYRASAPT